ncbi:hypothetical protein HOP60_01285 [Halomonas daqingensis]|uniref:Uncharacterized protein n=1 Tax=Billgrantia desiderata TaxID=52021 RepID=A0ABS9B002_9GAMM|nr:hypothetical protein [Halomonas desiderata]MCE8040785.1 hypothetical protein [Halomonas desiderata]MCE8045360.1 hypothetical protein [Halomonas desiderata]
MFFYDRVINRRCHVSVDVLRVLLQTVWEIDRHSLVDAAGGLPEVVEMFTCVGLSIDAAGNVTLVNADTGGEG